MSAIEFTPLGGVTEVGANSYLIGIDGLQILLDCGLHPKKEGFGALPEFSVLKRAPDAAIISHAHVDHCGALPYLVKLYPAVIPYCTLPTLKIMDRMLHNSVSVMGILRNERGIQEYPLYDHDAVDIAVRKTYGITFDREFGIHPDSAVRVAFSHAGHVLGSASVRVAMPGHTLFYTADICVTDQEIMSAFRLPDEARGADTLVIEATYGANETADAVRYQDEARRFAEAAAATLKRGGALLVPSFALGRTQEVLNMVARFQLEGRLPDVPVYASGLGRSVYEVYSRYEEHLKPGVSMSPLSQFGRVGDVWDPEVARALLKEPCIIVATSGMMIENTPSAMLAMYMVQEKHHGIFFVGYCDPDSLGYRLKHAKKGDRLRFALGAPAVDVVLDNIQSFHFSAHAPRGALQRIIDQVRPKNLIFVHGDPPAVEWMRNHSGDGCAKFVPNVGETVGLNA